LYDESLARLDSFDTCMTHFPHHRELWTDAQWRARLRRSLLNWFRHHARDLPWRQSQDPYGVWVSEIMLQQTQVATVESYFRRFRKRFPDVATLAAADEDEVLRFWEGLGYYRRARQMLLAARQIVDIHQGRFPETFDEVIALPGIGRYTAGAILSIALDQQYPILEANSQRVLARLVALRDPPTTSASQRLLWTVATQILPKKEVGRFNQAVMELGSLVCQPKQPACPQCPAASCCATFAKGLQDVVPPPKEKKPYTEVRETAVLAARNGRVLLRRCAPNERWAGLWDFPRFTSPEGPNAHHGVRVAVEQLTGYRVGVKEEVATLRHGVTRFRITLNVLRVEIESGRKHRGKDVRWVPKAELSDTPLSATGRKIAEMIGGPQATARRAGG